jgi:hypothetical protein
MGGVFDLPWFLIALFFNCLAPIAAVPIWEKRAWLFDPARSQSRTKPADPADA